MQKYDLKRATIKVIERRKCHSDRDAYLHLAIYQKEIKNLGMAIDRTQNRAYLEYQREIKKLRKRIRKFRTQEFKFDVWVKKYRKMIRVDWEYQVPYEMGVESRKRYAEMLKKVTDEAIRQCRIYLKAYPNTSKFGGSVAEFIGNKKEGRVFTKQGEILRIHVEKNLKSLYADKKPVQLRKYIGIELEFCAPIGENEFAVKLFRSGIHKFAQLKKDGSLRPHEGETGYELAILLEETNYKKRLKQITSLLTSVKAVSQDRRAGLHVHIDMRKRNKDLVYSNLVACQYALLSVVDPKRYDNEFCRVVKSRKFPTEFTGQREERYKTINAAAFYKYKTLEVRMHEGSVDYTQISNWVDLLIRIANYSKVLKNKVVKVSALGKRINLDKKLFSYLQDRSCFWQVHNSSERRLERPTESVTELERRIRNEYRDIAPLIGTTSSTTPIFPQSPSYGLVGAAPSWDREATRNSVTNTTSNATIAVSNELPWEEPSMADFDNDILNADEEP